MAYGLGPLEPVDVIAGPGNAYVTEAKRQVGRRRGHRRPGRPQRAGGGGLRGRRPRAGGAGPAGPGRARPRRAAGRDRARRRAAGRGRRRLRARRGRRDAVRRRARPPPRAWRCPSSSRPSTWSWWAPRPRRWPAHVRRAGCLFVGNQAATAFGDYVAGSNHVLPTGGAARFQSALSASTFRRRMARVTFPGDSAAQLAPAGRRDRARRGLPRTRRIDGAKGMSRSAQISRTTGETEIDLTLDLDGDGAGSRDTGRRLLRPHARRRGAPRRAWTWT